MPIPETAFEDSHKDIPLNTDTTETFGASLKKFFGTEDVSLYEQTHTTYTFAVKTDSIHSNTCQRLYNHSSNAITGVYIAPQYVYIIFSMATDSRTNLRSLKRSGKHRFTRETSKPTWTAYKNPITAASKASMMNRAKKVRRKKLETKGIFQSLTDMLFET